MSQRFTITSGQLAGVQLTGEVEATSESHLVVTVEEVKEALKTAEVVVASDN